MKGQTGWWRLVNYNTRTIRGAELEFTSERKFRLLTP